MVYTKNISIYANDVGRKVTLMFTFEAPPGAGLYKDYFPLAWRVAFIPAQGNQQIDLNYTAQLAFNKAQVQAGNLVSPGTWTKCDPGQSTTLTAQSGSFVWGTPAQTGGDVAKAINGTTYTQDIGVGFAKEGAVRPDTVLVFRNAGVGYAVAAQIRALLKVYAVLDYRETEIVRAEIESIMPIKEINMADIGVANDYKLTFKPVTGTFALTPF